ncbi:MAG: hypothetical protein ACK5ZO_04090 [Gemmatimonas sp.]|uniref:hypothetical protein n=1 Tax=Gemmatimonas sp. TaxID=1962908 RepID=UPI00391F4701
MKKLLKVLGGAFAVLFVLAVIGSMTMPETASPPPTEQPASSSAARRPVRADLVALDFKTGRLTIEALVPRSVVNADGDAFVWAFFTNPDENNDSRSDVPIRVRPDFSRGDPARVVAVKEGFHWWQNDYAPRGGYLAFVFAGPDSAALYLPAMQRDKNPALSVSVAREAGAVKP